MDIRVRSAPSPTGLLHLGNARTALLNWLFAARRGGNVLLRLDDTDERRSRPEYTEALREDLAWLGLFDDQLVRQSARLKRYEQAVQRLKEQECLYPCWETETELEAKLRLAAARGKPPIYDRSSLRLTQTERQERLDQGHLPHWRFFLNSETVAWADAVRGSVSFSATHLSDPILVRGDGTYVYTLASVVDDLELGVTHILRGTSPI